MVNEVVKSINDATQILRYENTPLYLKKKSFKKRIKIGDKQILFIVQIR